MTALRALRALWRPLDADERRGGLRWFGVVAVLSFVLLLARRLEFVVQPQFWAEDGAVFFRDQLTLGFSRALVETHAGYVHVLPRLLAGALWPLPTVHQPLAYTLVASAIAAVFCAWVVRDEHRRWLPSRRLRAALALWIACAPVGREVIGNLVNLQWYGLWFGFLLVAGAMPARPAAQVAWAAALALIGVSAPGAIALVPLLLVRAALSTGRARALSLVLTLPALALAASGWSARDEGPRPYFRGTKLDVEAVTTVGDAAAGAARVVCRVLSEPLLGERDALGAIRVAGDAAPSACALIIVLVAWVTWRRARPEPRALLALAAAFLVVYVGALCVGRGHVITAAARFGVSFGMGRYFVPTSPLVVAALLVAVSHVPRVPRRPGAASSTAVGGRHVAAAWLGLLLAPAAVLCFHLRYASDGTWPRSAATLDAAIRERATRPLSLPVRPEPWTVRVWIAGGIPLRDGSAWPPR